MARTNNLSNFLTDVANAIKTKKGSETAIPAANFDTEILALPSQGVYEQKIVNVSANGSQTILPSSGYDAIDELTLTVAVPEKQLQTKAYSFTQNTSIQLSPDTGYDGFDTVTVNINVPGQQINNQDKTVTPTTSQQVISADQGYTGLGNVTVNAVTSSIDQNIVAGNIKKNIEILGVTGTYEGGGSGSSDVKLFDTVAHMQADPNPQEGDLAIVYGEALIGITRETKFDSCIFPNTVVLNSAISVIGPTYFMADESSSDWYSAYIDGNGRSITFMGEGDSGMTIIRYTSSDGITFTRTDGGEELVDFGVTIQWDYMAGPFDDNIGNFIKINANQFDGLYIYSGNSYIIAPTQLNAESSDVYKRVFYSKNGVQTGILTTNVSNTFTDTNAEVYANIQAYYNTLTPRILTDQDKTINSNTTIIPCKSDGTPLLDTSRVTSMYGLFSNTPHLISISKLDTSNVTSMEEMFSTCGSLTYVPVLDTSNVTNMTDTFFNCNLLSNESLNNILAMCINSAVTSNKTLAYIGLSSDQIQTCATLSNYQAFLNAGWLPYET